MSFLGKSLLDLKSLTTGEAQSLFDLTMKIELKGWSVVSKNTPKNTLVALVFLEPSTRTTSSFEIAALRSGFMTSKLFAESSSTKKGETVLDTLLTLNAMAPDLFIVRHGTSEKLSEIAPQLSAPLINAGEGVSGHPTQGLLDAYTILKERKKIEGEKVLIIGDVAHSRVASSNIELLSKLGAEVAVCGPEAWHPKNSKLKSFDSLVDGLKWSTVAMALRIQKERHASENSDLESQVVQKFQLNKNSLKNLGEHALIMHPGPFNRGVELTDDVLLDPRSVIWKQMGNGVFIRAALMAQILGTVQ